MGISFHFVVSYANEELVPNSLSDSYPLAWLPFPLVIPWCITLNNVYYQKFDFVMVELNPLLKW